MQWLPFAASRLALVAVTFAVATTTVRAAEQDPVVAVVACDSYADLRSQVAWFGEQVGNPTLAGLAESFILLATQGQGLAGLDVRRPLAIVFTAVGDEPEATAFVPVKDLDKLLAAVERLTGPTQGGNGVRTFSGPGGAEFQVSEQDGWALVARRGARPVAGARAEFVDPLVKDYSLGIRVFPSRMPEAVRRQFADGVRQVYAQAAPGQQVDEQALAGSIAALADIESLTLGFGADADAGRMTLEARAVMIPGSEAAALIIGAGQSAATVGLPPAADGKPPALQAHYAQPLPDNARTAVQTALSAAVLFAGDDPTTKACDGAIRDLIAAMLDAGGVDAALSIDTTAATPEKGLPAVTVGMRIKDGAALQETLRGRFARPIPDIEARFDAGRQASATLHEIVLDISARTEAKQLGDKVTITVAVAPDYAFVLTGDDAARRVAAALAAGGKPNGNLRPFGGLGISLAGLAAYAAKLAAATAGAEPQAEALQTVSREAAEKPSTRVEFAAEPIARGIVLRLSADAGAIQTIAAGVTARQSVPSPRRGPASEAAGRRPAAPPALAP